MKRAEKIVKLGEIFCRWNDPEHPHNLGGDLAMLEISKVFDRETRRAWKYYLDHRKVKS